jgi:hypothetical protein
MTELVDFVREHLADNENTSALLHAQLANADVTPATASQIAEMTLRHATARRIVVTLKNTLGWHDSGRVSPVLGNRPSVAPYCGGQMPFELRMREEIEILREKLNSETYKHGRGPLGRAVDKRKAQGDALGALQQQITWHAEEGRLSELNRMMSAWGRLRAHEQLIAANSPAAAGRAAAAAQRTIDALNAQTAHSPIAGAGLIVSR